MAEKSPLEIERKWMVTGWPDHQLPLLFEQNMNQGYVTVHPTVRIREENTVLSNDPKHPVTDSYVLCFKSSGLLSRKEIEINIEKEKYEQLEDLIGLPLIHKVRRTYQLKEGRKLEVNHVDAGQPTAFWYAEIEFSSEAEARAYDPRMDHLEDFLSDDVTNQPGQSMGAYWESTRLKDQTDNQSGEES